MGRNSDSLGAGLRLELLKKRAETELEKTQWLSKSELEKLQTRRLRILLTHAYEFVPYYNRIFRAMGLRPDDIRSQTDLLKLPVLTKEDVRSHADQLLSSMYSKKDLEERSTSGSTSIPLRVYRNQDANAYGSANSSRQRSWMEIDRNDLAACVGPPGLDRYFPQAPEHLRLLTWEITEERLEKLVESIRRHRPRHLRGFPTGLSLLTKFCIERGIEDISFKCILSSGEKLFEDEKEKMEDTFNAEIYQTYAANEVGVMAMDCPHHTGLHVCSESLFTEIIRDGEPASQGETGSIAVTPLFNYCMPLIRYDLQDATSTLGESCPCGRGLPLMSYVEGRITDLLVTPDGRWLGDSTFHSRVFSHIDVKQYRITQENLSTLIVELIPGTKYDVRAEEFIIESLRKVMGRSVEITVRLTDQIETTPSGKRRVVLSKVPVRFS